MTGTYKATPEQLHALWHELFSHDDTVSSGDVEVIARAALERWGNYPGIPDSSTPPPVATDGGLVERVSDAITSETGSRWASTEARAAILEVAKWLREQGLIIDADLLEQEAGR
jgi:hypothetical protein